jgi:hypothetical protein
MLEVHCSGTFEEASKSSEPPVMGKRLTSHADRVPAWQSCSRTDLAGNQVLQRLLLRKVKTRMGRGKVGGNKIHAVIGKGLVGSHPGDAR